MQQPPPPWQSAVPQLGYHMQAAHRREGGLGALFAGGALRASINGGTGLCVAVVGDLALAAWSWRVAQASCCEVLAQ